MFVIQYQLFILHQRRSVKKLLITKTALEFSDLKLKNMNLLL